MEKGITVEQIREAARMLRRAGIRVGFFLQFGYPGEDREDIEKTFQLVRDCRPDQIGVSVSYPLPGTRFHEKVRSQLGEKQNWVDSEDLAMMYRGPFTTTFYRRLHRVLHKELRALKALDTLRSPISRTHFREAAALVFHGATLPLARARMESAAHASHEEVRS
jgi:anaerobic magnesium-protoporphyrin IX monomethyl ester cyclase